MFKKIIISSKEYTIKFPENLQGKPVEIIIIPADEKANIKKKLSSSYFQV